MRYVNYLTASLATVLVPSLALAQEAAHAAGGNVSLGAGIAISVAVLGGALGQGKVVSAIAEAIGRNPSASGKLNVPLFIGLALIESLVILSFVIALNLANKA